MGTLVLLHVVVAGLTATANAVFAVADLRAAGFVLANSAEVGVPPGALPVLGLAKGAGAVGLVLGLVGPHWVGVAAASGLALFFTGALAVHLRARVLHNLAFPGGMWALSLGSLVVALAR